MDIYELIDMKPEQREAFDRSVLLENEASKAGWRKSRGITDLVVRQKAEAEILGTGFQPGTLHPRTPANVLASERQLNEEVGE